MEMNVIKKVEKVKKRIWHSESEIAGRCRRKWEEWKRGRDKVIEINNEGVEAIGKSRVISDKGKRWKWRREANLSDLERESVIVGLDFACLHTPHVQGTFRNKSKSKPCVQNGVLWWHASKHSWRLITDLISQFEDTDFTWSVSLRTQTVLDLSVSAHRLQLVSLVLSCLHVPLAQGAARTFWLQNVMPFGKVGTCARLRHINPLDSLERI